jgi:hypothetical protein
MPIEPAVFMRGGGARSVVALGRAEPCAVCRQACRVHACHGMETWLSSAVSPPASSSAAVSTAVPRTLPDRIDAEGCDALRRLFVACRDAQFGFALCALFVSDGALRAALRRRALHCRLATELFERSLGEAAAVAARPQGWALTVGTTDDDGSIVEKYREGEVRVLTAFRDALDARLPDDWAALVRRQFESALDQYHEVVQAADHARSA